LLGGVTRGQRQNVNGISFPLLKERTVMLGGRICLGRYDQNARAIAARLIPKALVELALNVGVLLMTKE
jgi:hypothetical protein